MSFHYLLNKFQALILPLILFSCNNNFNIANEFSIESVEIQLLPSFGERSSFQFEKNSKLALIEENWRLADTVDIMHQYESEIDLKAIDFKDAIDLFPNNSNMFLGRCSTLDGIRFVGAIDVQADSAFVFNYQYCSSDSSTVIMTDLIFSFLKREFNKDTITSQYLDDIYSTYCATPPLTNDSVVDSYMKLNKLREKAFHKYFR